MAYGREDIKMSLCDLYVFDRFVSESGKKYVASCTSDDYIYRVISDGKIVFEGSRQAYYSWKASL